MRDFWYRSRCGRRAARPPPVTGKRPTRRTPPYGLPGRARRHRRQRARPLKAQRRHALSHAELYVGRCAGLAATPQCQQLCGSASDDDGWCIRQSHIHPAYRKADACHARRCDYADATKHAHNCAIGTRRNHRARIAPRRTRIATERGRTQAERRRAWTERRSGYEMNRDEEESDQVKSSQLMLGIDSIPSRS